MPSTGTGARRLPRRSRPSAAAAQHSLPLQRRRRLSLSEDVEPIAVGSQPLPDSTELQPVDKNAIYFKVAAQADKDRVFGLGSQYSGRHPYTGSSSWNSTASSHAYVSKARLAELENEIEAQRVEAQALRILAEKQIKLIKEQFELIDENAKDATKRRLMLERLLLRFPPSPPRSPPHSQ